MEEAGRQLLGQILINALLGIDAMYRQCDFAVKHKDNNGGHKLRDGYLCLIMSVSGGSYKTRQKTSASFSNHAELFVAVSAAPNSRIG